MVGISALSSQLRVFLAEEDELLFEPQAAKVAAETKTVAPAANNFANFIQLTPLNYEIFNNSF